MKLFHIFRQFVLQPFLAFMQQGLQSKDVGTCTACLKFIVAVTTGGSGSQQLKFLVNSMMAFTDFMELVWKRCQLYVRMRSQPYSLACQALKNLISHASTYQFTTERIKTMCLFFKVGGFFLPKKDQLLKAVQTVLPTFDY